MSKITLGTAQFGSVYGISGKALSSRPEEIMAQAAANGINVLDTAQAYGDAEILIGQFMQKRSNWDPRIITKISIESAGEDELGRDVEAKVNESLRRLNQNRLYGLMLHNFSYLAKYRHHLVEALESLKLKDKVKKIGISIYSPEELEESLHYKELEIFQGPINILDQRIPNSGLLEKLYFEGKEFFARSIFLQGLFFLEKQVLRLKLPEAEPYLRRVCLLADEFGFSVAEMAFAFVRDLDGVTSIVLGVKGIGQLRSNIHMLNGPKLPESLRREIEEMHSAVPERIYDPRKW